MTRVHALCEGPTEETFTNRVLAPELAARGVLAQLRRVRQEFATPEDINDSPMTAPSKRIKALCPAYQKVFDATRVAGQLTIAAIRRDCLLFDDWVQRLEALAVAPA